MEIKEPIPVNLYKDGIEFSHVGEDYLILVQCEYGTDGVTNEDIHGKEIEEEWDVVLGVVDCIVAQWDEDTDCFFPLAYGEAKEVAELWVDEHHSDLCCEDIKYDLSI